MRAVLWDLDGTAHDTQKLIISSFEHSIKQLGYPLKSKEEMIKTLGLPLSECYRVLVPDGNIEALCKLHQEFQRDNPHLVVPFPNTISTISELKKFGFKNAAVTSRTRESALSNLETTKVGILMDHIIAKEDVRNPKPNPEGIFSALNYLQVLSSNAWMIGDSHVDIYAGKAAGTRTIGFTNGDPSEEIIASSPDYLVDEISQIVPIILTELKIATNLF